MSKTLGIDLGTNSIGMTLREDESFQWFGTYTFKKGVGEGKSGEFSLAAERTKHRSSRRLYNARRYRKWETLKVLIENDFCPLPIEKLNRWKTYKPSKGRVYPVDNKPFQDWLKLDFNSDGKPDHSSPYQIRRLLIEEKLDLSEQQNRFKIGRAFYHIAQRRGFKSSRKVGKNEKKAVYKGSTETGTIGRNEYENLIVENGSLGAAFAHLEDKGIRVRNRYTLRSDYLKEAQKIGKVQKLGEDFKENIIKAIFFQRPLRSQKGLVGKCTMESRTLYKNGKKIETGKPRCPVSHFLFEEYRAWSFVNNIKYRTNPNENFRPLPLELKKEVINEKLMIKGHKTAFKKIRNFIVKGPRKNWELNYKKRMDKMSVSTCPISAYFKAAFGVGWKDILIKTNKTRTNRKGETHTVTYTIDDLWHIAFSFEDEEYYEEFLVKKLDLKDGQVDQLKKMWTAFPIGYAQLSLKAIKNILPFLKEGMIYSEAVFIAKIPDIIGKSLFENNREGIIEELSDLIKQNQDDKTIINIVNSLIANYKALNVEHKHGYKNTEYKLTEYDEKDIWKACSRHFGANNWGIKADKEKSIIFNNVYDKYQKFFETSKRDYFRQPKLVNHIQVFIKEAFDATQKDVDKLYHPSMTEIYAHKENQKFLKSPETRAFKNPMAYKTLHKLRHVINHLLKKEIIDDETRIVVEVARDLNYKNKRAAIEDYQRERERENMEFGKAIAELIKDPDFKGNADPNNKKDKEKLRLWTEQLQDRDEVLSEVLATKSDIKKYRLWKEQNCFCFYTGNPIKITDSFNDNIIDFEHTIPRSKSFDNSLANLTVCYANYNRNIKGNKIPTELPNYEKEAMGFAPIKPHLKNWEERVDSLHSQIQTQVKNAKFAIDKETKDRAVCKRHKLQMELDYWKNKVDRFTRKDIPQGFKNSQLIDTQIISKYAYHYLRTVFGQVDTIKGNLTAQFRKIYGIEPEGEEKDRTEHFHHAIDAAVLTMIPSSAKRKDILNKKYHFEEQNPNKQYHEKPFEGFRYSMIEKIKKEILINNMKDQDQTLTPTIKKVRKRGKIEYLRAGKGAFKRDGSGEKIPKIMQGDAIRGQLNEDTFFGKIKIAAKDKRGSILRDENGDIIYKTDKKGNEIYKMVYRKPIEDVKLKNVVDDSLKDYLKKQIKDGVKQNELKDFQGKIIRHVRVIAKRGRGDLDPKKVTELKEQTYKSDKDYKNYYYTNTGDNYMFGLYETRDGKRKIISINILDAAKYSVHQNEDSKREIFKTKEPVMIGQGKKKKEGELKHIFQPGQKVLFFFDNKDELKDLGKEDLSKRLYFIKRFHDASRGSMIFQHHLEARSDDELKDEFGKKGSNGFSINKFDESFVPPRILFTPKKDLLIFEGKGFEMTLDGEIKFKF